MKSGVTFCYWDHAKGLAYFMPNNTTRGWEKSPIHLHGFQSPKCLMWPIHTSQGYLWRCFEIIQPVADFYIFFSCCYMKYNVSYNQWHLRLDECDFAIGGKGLWLYNPTPLSYRRRNRPPASNVSLSPTESIQAPCLNWWGFTVLMSYSGLELFCLKIAKRLIWETKKLEETLCDGKNKSQHAFEQLQSHKYASGTLSCKPAVLG